MMTAVLLMLLGASILQSPTKATAKDEIREFLMLNREVQILRAENLIAEDPDNRDAKKRLGAAKKLRLKPTPLVPSGVGQIGYWPERRVQISRSLGGGSHLAMMGIVEVVVRGVPDVPGNMILVVTGSETIRKTGVKTTKRNLEGQGTEFKASDEQYDVPVVEVLNIKEATEALEKELAELKKAKP